MIFSLLVWLASAGTKSALNVWALLANIYPDSYGVEPREAVDDVRYWMLAGRPCRKEEEINLKKARKG